MEYFTTYSILYTTSCGCQDFSLEKRAKNFVNLPFRKETMGVFGENSPLIQEVDEVIYEQIVNRWHVLRYFMFNMGCLGYFVRGDHSRQRIRSGWSSVLPRQSTVPP